LTALFAGTLPFLIGISLKMKKLTAFNIAVVSLFCTSGAAVAADLVGVGMSMGHSVFDSTVPSLGVKQSTNLLIGTMTYALDSGWYVSGALGYSDGSTTIKSNSTGSDSNAQVAAFVFTKPLGANSALSLRSSYAHSKVEPAASSSSTASAPGIGISYTSRHDFTKVGPTRFGVDYAVNRSRIEQDNSRTVSAVTVNATQEWNLGMWVPSVGIGYTVADSESVQGNGDKDFFRSRIGLSAKLTEKDRIGLTYSSISGRNQTSEYGVQLSYSKFF
jgi:hypothetical protein